MFEKLLETSPLKVLNNVSPETETLISALGVYIYTTLINSPDSLPNQVKPLIEVMNSMPSIQSAIEISKGIFFLGFIHGLVRINSESLPFYKAYVNVFILNKQMSDSEQSS